MNKTIIIILAVLAVLVLWVGFSYNSLVRQNEAVTGQWSQVESSYQRRFDLIPNLVASVKGILLQEQKVFGDIADARTRYSGAVSVDEKAGALSQLDSSLSRLLVIVESYPVLKSSENVQSLIAEIAGSENRINVERNRYNETVQKFNTSIKIFPKSLIASTFGFGERTYFKADEQASTAPKVELQ